ncbi:unnamed protein product [Coccothraustes coccothraustes]
MAAPIESVASSLAAPAGLRQEGAPRVAAALPSPWQPPRPRFLLAERRAEPGQPPGAARGCCEGPVAGRWRAGGPGPVLPGPAAASVQPSALVPTGAPVP